MEGLVVKSTGSWYSVLLEGECVRARLRGSLRLFGGCSTTPVVVGDRVECVEDGGEWLIKSVALRRNCLVRRSTNLSHQKQVLASNIDRLYLVVTMSNPSTPMEFIDRVLASAEANSIPTTLLVNKIDVAPPTAHFLEIYKKAGYDVLQVSSKGGEGVEELRVDIGCQTVLFSGNSGVGKSSIINALGRNSVARTGEVSAVHHKGMHTTTFSEIFFLSGGGYVIDTPGIKGFGLVDIDSQELYHYFREIMIFSKGCGFYNCTHTHEPGCAVKLAVRSGAIALERYSSYCSMVDQKSQKYR